MVARRIKTRLAPPAAPRRYGDETFAEAAMPVSPMIEITYCRLCGWGLRAGWMAQELLTTFAEELGSVTLTPDGTGGVFEVRVNNEVIWSRSGTQRDQTTHPRPRRPRSLARAYGLRITTLRDCRQNSHFARGVCGGPPSFPWRAARCGWLARWRASKNRPLSRNEDPPVGEE